MTISNRQPTTSYRREGRLLAVAFCLLPVLSHSQDSDTSTAPVIDDATNEIDSSALSAQTGELDMTVVESTPKPARTPTPTQTE